MKLFRDRVSLLPGPIPILSLSLTLPPSAVRAFNVKQKEEIFKVQVLLLIVKSYLFRLFYCNKEKYKKGTKYYHNVF